MNLACKWVLLSWLSLASVIFPIVPSGSHCKSLINAGTADTWQRKKKCNNRDVELLGSHLRAESVYEVLYAHLYNVRLWSEFFRNKQHSGPKHASERLEHICITYRTKTRLMIVNLTLLAIVFRYARYPRFESQRDRYAILMGNIYLYTCMYVCM